MATSNEPSLKLAKRVLPPQLLRALQDLVSRCGEKDLFDLSSLLENSQTTLSELIEHGAQYQETQYDGGMDAESVLMVLGGTRLRAEACDFSLDQSVTPDEVFRRIVAFQHELEKQLELYLNEQPAPPLAGLVKRLQSQVKKR